MHNERVIVRVGLSVSALLSALAILSGCSDRNPGAVKAPASSPAPSTPPATAPTSTPAPSSSGPVIAPGTGTDVVTKKGTETGMVGGESGTVAASGKPGTGTASGAGTGAAQASDEKTSNKK
ncbi:MAG: hypothetical protein H7X75_05865 [Burkholderiaceae bacterium]|nr:hypothetical protein [Burkholderiaceae bacterium]